MSRRTKAAAVALTVAALVTASAAAETPHFPKPTRYEVAPAKGCGSTIVTVSYPKGKTGPTKKRIPVPPAPGLKATALSNSLVRLDWSLTKTPASCRTRTLLLSIGHYDDWLPKTVYVDTHGKRNGSTRVSWHAPSKPTDVALASASTENGLRSRVIGVLIGH
jgi:hypothetical protein